MSPQRVNGETIQHLDTIDHGCAVNFVSMIAVFEMFFVLLNRIKWFKWNLDFDLYSDSKE